MLRFYVFNVFNVFVHFRTFATFMSNRLLLLYLSEYTLCPQKTSTFFIKGGRFFGTQCTLHFTSCYLFQLLFSFREVLGLVIRFWIHDF